jgi:LAO/AO transport system kinase
MHPSSDTSSQPPAAIAALLERFRAGRPAALGRAISIVESEREGFQDLLHGVLERGPTARRVGLTGPPGAGKSSLLAALAASYRARDERVGVVAVDPTSPFSGGALLGDRIRMQGLATDTGVFIRSMATRGAMGGLARATRDAADLLDAAGFDWVLIETVGVGQDEVDVVSSVDTVLVVVVPGLGDDIQAIKAGIMEIADVFVLNKADREGADRAHRDIANVLALADRPEWVPPIVRTVASKSEGIAEVLAAVAGHREHLAGGGRLAARRRDQLRLRVESILKERVLAAARDAAGLEAEVARGFAERTDPYGVAEALFRGVVRAESRSGARP